ncbi:FtsH protease activity modulator HflK [Rubritalea profundi]|uniref:Protein HflK n=1 Tax=Rubritalea profundi TaxID=1658618 RepID=A0A2S7U1P4_9BACT|nr:FtsH protease activity modulator HflK [Rubritalea profundi]PQJ28427.1 HflK protein [Rubritalea profundi]
MNKVITIDGHPVSFSPRLLLGVPLALVVLYGIFTSFYTVSPESVAVVQRFGKYTHIEDPGLRFKIPFGVDKATIVPIDRQLKLEFGFGRQGDVTNPHQVGTEPDKERDMVTGDLNAAQVEWILQYSITDPYQYLFQLRNPGSTLRDLTESVVCEVIGDRTVDEVLTIGRTEIGVESLSRLSEIVATLNMGITAERIELINVNPPGPVQRSFGEVNRAQQERERMINEANGEYNRVIPKAKGTAQQRISGAEGYAFQRVNEAEGDVTRFRDLLAQYEKAPAITKQRLYLETMSEVLPKLGKKVILDEDAKQFLPLMNLGK